MSADPEPSTDGPGAGATKAADAASPSSAATLLALAGELSNERVRSFERLVRSERASYAWKWITGVGAGVGLALAASALIWHGRPWYPVPLYVGVVLLSFSWTIFLGVISDEQFAQISRIGRPVGNVLWWVGLALSLLLSTATAIAAVVLLPQVPWPKYATAFEVLCMILGLSALFSGGVGFLVGTSGSIPLTSHPERRKPLRVQLGYVPFWLAVLVVLAIGVYVLNVVQSVFPIAVVAAFIVPLALSLGSRRAKVNQAARDMVTALDEAYLAARTAQRRRFPSRSASDLGPPLLRLQAALADSYLPSALQGDGSLRAEPEIQVVVSHLVHRFAGIPLTALAELRKERIQRFLSGRRDREVAGLTAAFILELRRQLIR